MAKLKLDQAVQEVSLCKTKVKYIYIYEMFYRRFDAIVKLELGLDIGILAARLFWSVGAKAYAANAFKSIVFVTLSSEIFKF